MNEDLQDMKTVDETEMEITAKVQACRPVPEVTTNLDISHEIEAQTLDERKATVMRQWLHRAGRSA